MIFKKCILYNIQGYFLNPLDISVLLLHTSSHFPWWLMMIVHHIGTLILKHAIKKGKNIHKIFFLGAGGPYYIYNIVSEVPSLWILNHNAI